MVGAPAKAVRDGGGDGWVGRSRGAAGGAPARRGGATTDVTREHRSGSNHAWLRGSQGGGAARSGGHLNCWGARHKGKPMARPARPARTGPASCCAAAVPALDMHRHNSPARACPSAAPAGPLGPCTRPSLTCPVHLHAHRASASPFFTPGSPCSAPWWKAALGEQAACSITAKAQGGWAMSEQSAAGREDEEGTDGGLLPLGNTASFRCAARAAADGRDVSTLGRVWLCAGLSSPARCGPPETPVTYGLCWARGEGREQDRNSAPSPPWTRLLGLDPGGGCNSSGTRPNPTQDSGPWGPLKERTGAKQRTDSRL